MYRDPAERAVAGLAARGERILALSPYLPPAPLSYPKLTLLRRSSP